jgi:hypothetical protein
MWLEVGMIESNLDAFCCFSGKAGSRRKALAALVGALGLLDRHLAPDSALAKKRKKKHKKGGGTTNPPPSSPPPSTVSCPTGYSVCGEQCFDLTDNTANCGACGVVCSQSKICCRGVCVDLQDDDANCGDCGHACLTRDDDTPLINAAEICSSGVCVECNVAGIIRMGNPHTCCRGLVLCSSTMSGLRCVTEGTACPP